MPNQNITNELNFSKLRATDLRDCPRVILPPPRPKEEEAVLTSKEIGAIQILNRYRLAKCSKKGEQLVDNLSDSERKGFEKLRKNNPRILK